MSHPRKHPRKTSSKNTYLVVVFVVSHERILSCCKYGIYNNASGAAGSVRELIEVNK